MNLFIGENIAIQLNKDSHYFYSQIGKCVYVGKKLEFAGMRVQVSDMWSLGEKVQCGAIISTSRVWQHLSS